MGGMGAASGWKLPLSQNSIYHSGGVLKGGSEWGLAKHGLLEYRSVLLRCDGSSGLFISRSCVFLYLSYNILRHNFSKYFTVLQKEHLEHLNLLSHFSLSMSNLEKFEWQKYNMMQTLSYTSMSPY